MATIDTDKIKRETDLLSVASRYTSLKRKRIQAGVNTLGLARSVAEQTALSYSP